MGKTVLNFIIKNRVFIIPILFAVLSFFVILFIILPQGSNISELNKAISAERKKIDVLNKSKQVITSEDDATLDSLVATATNTLPTSKDITKIFDALNKAASISGTSIEEFSLDVGGVYGRAALLPQAPLVPVILVSVRVTGDSSKNLANFATTIEKVIPLSTVKTIDISNTTGAYEIGFFYKPVDVGKIAQTDNVSAPSQADIDFINKLGEFSQQ